MCCTAVGADVVQASRTLNHIADGGNKRLSVVRYWAQAVWRILSGEHWAGLTVTKLMQPS